MVWHYVKNLFRTLRLIAQTFPAVMTRIMPIPIRMVGSGDDGCRPSDCNGSFHLWAEMSMTLTAAMSTAVFTPATIRW